MRPLSFALLLTCAVTLGCNRPKPPDSQAVLRKSLQGVLVYPRSTTLDANTGNDAAQVTLTTLDSVGFVARWFRDELQHGGWNLQSDVTNPDGSIAITAMKGSRPVWVTMRPNVGGPGSTYTVIGAVVSDSASAADSAARKPPAR